MNAVPPLLAGKRRRLAVVLAVLALGEALLAVLLANALDRVLSSTHPPLMPLLTAGGCAVMLAASLLLARWVGENFAQDFVNECRAAIFAEVARHPAAVPADANSDARWLTLLLNDMAALRNYALRGTVRLWTSVLAGGAAAGWIALTMPPLRPAMLPLLLAAGGVAMLLWPLSRAITDQRRARGKLNRFLVRRVRAELSGSVSPKGHGFRKLAELSDTVAGASVRRARCAGIMDALATLGGLAAVLAAVWAAQNTAPGTAGIAGSLTLLGFVAARLLETVRALHARAGGRIALVRLEQLLDPAPGDIARSALRALAIRCKQRAAAMLALPGRPARLAAPAHAAAPEETGA
jgi:ABC-type multidrug transport system fused ATPase/permease subunit